MEYGYRLECKYARRKKDYIYCTRDCTVRKKGCPCQHYKSSAWSRFKARLRNIFE